jgi:hypothetical protein
MQVERWLEGASTNPNEGVKTFIGAFLDFCHSSLPAATPARNSNRG